MPLTWRGLGCSAEFARRRLMPPRNGEGALNRVFISLIIGVVGVSGLLIFQATRSGTSSVFLPSELIKAELTPHQRIRVVGRVSQEPFRYAVEPKFELEFVVHDPSSEATTLQVRYQGVKPDMFAAGRDVIIDGEYLNGRVEATELLTQCPSKYEPPQPGNGADNP